MHILITGGAGFIGSSLAERMVQEGHQVTVVDIFDPFYPAEIKYRNISILIGRPQFTLFKLDICDLNQLLSELKGEYDVIAHLAAKAGVHASIKDPIGCQQANVLGTQHMLEFAKIRGIQQFVFASSSSVYGINPNVPWREDDPQLLPISPYASSKLSCELLGHVYAHLHGIRFISLRFFTVYGPKQRPDLAIYKFTNRILSKEPIPVYGDGSTQRDYTFISDVLDGIVAATTYKSSQYEIINIGNNRTISLSEMINTIEDVFNVKAEIDRLPMQDGDVPMTYADINKAQELLNYHPKVGFTEGMIKFKSWFFDNMK